METKKTMMKLSRKRRKRARPVQRSSLPRAAVQATKTIYSSNRFYHLLNRIAEVRSIYSNHPQVPLGNQISEC